MRTIFLIQSLILSSLFLSGCYFKGGGGSLGAELVIAASEREDQSDRRDSNSRRRGSSLGECREDTECEAICEDVYDEDGEDENEGKVETCLKVRHRLAIQFESILEILEEPYDSSLRNIEEDAFF